MRGEIIEKERESECAITYHVFLLPGESRATTLLFPTSS